MSARSARRLLERLLCDRGLLEQLSAQPLTAAFFAEICAREGYACSLAEVHAAADAEPSVPAELWFAALLSALMPAAETEMASSSATQAP
jgi:hypothetical protein